MTFVSELENLYTMRKILFCVTVLLIALASCKTEKKDIVKNDFDFASKQLTFAMTEVSKAIEEESAESREKREKKNSGPLVNPRTINPDGKLSLVASRDWTSGFFPGELWYMYEYTKDKKWETAARKYTDPLEREKTNGGTHDMGFKVYCSFGNGYRLTKDENYKNILLKSAYTLTTRYQPNAKIIRSWDHSGDKWKCPVIIDNMMNLEMLFYASKVSGDKRYYDIAVSHANTTLKNHFRDDFSTYHVVDYDTITGVVKDQATCQGYSDNSTWSRGQAWAIYGYTMMYRETKDSSYLNAAIKATDFYLKNLPEDLVPLWDFNVGQEGFTPEGKSYAVEFKEKLRDASAAAVVCSGLFELGQLTNNKAYIDSATKMLKSLASPNYRATLGSNGNFILMHSVGSIPHKNEIDVPLTYADYYFLEALTRYKKLKD